MERTFLWVMACVVMASARSLHAGNIISVTSGESIQAAIDIAVDGTLIQVGPGLYTENIDFLGKNISVVATNGSAATTLAAPGSLMPIVTITNAAEMNDILFEGFTVTGGNVESNGAGIFINDADPVIRGCSIENNTALLDGGGVYINGGAEPVFEECLFTGNDADRGGAVYAESATPVYKDCIFRNNTASRGAGMANIGGSSPMVIQCLFHDNVASAFGGGMYNAGGSDPAMIQCTFSRNGAFTGGGMYLDGSGATSVNSIYWDNTDTSGTTSSAQINVQAGTPIVTSSIVQGGFAGAGNLNADPLFENPVGGDFQIADFSPAIDAGDNTAVPMSRMVDLDDNPRFVDDEGVTDTGIGTAPIVDIGVFEHQINSELMFIAVPATFGLIQEAINAAGPNAVIEISAGTYNETLDIKGKALTMRSTDPTNPTVVQNTIIDAGGMTGVGPVITMNTGEGDDTILNGLTITGGNAFLGGGLFLDQTSPIVMNCDFAMHNSGVGGAVYAFDGTPCFDNCSFSGSTTGLGGGIYFEDCDDAKVTNCLFTSNTCGEGGGIHNTNSNTIIDSCAFVSNNGLVGGGIYNTQSDPLISNCTFESNEAQDGAGIYNVNQSDPRIANSRFTGNMASNRGGGILMISCDPFIVNCIFDSNSGRLGGGLYSSDSSSPTVVNCTYFANMAKIEGGGVYNADDDIVAGLTIANCIFFTNLPEQIFEGAGSTLTVRNSNVQGGFAGIDNIDAAPQFLNPGSGNFRLFGTSPCVDAGDETLLFMDFWDLDGDMMMGENVPVDFEGNMRVEGFDVDMGAFELNGTGCVGDCAPDNLDGTYGNGIVNVDDLVLAITSFGPGSGPCDIAPLGGNGEINIDDLIGIIAAFGACP